MRELGIAVIASRLGVAPVLVDLWRTGRAAMPRQEFLLLVDMLVELKPDWEDWNEIS